jgi:hypothetical protein
MQQQQQQQQASDRSMRFRHLQRPRTRSLIDCDFVEMFPENKSTVELFQDVVLLSLRPAWPGEAQCSDALGSKRCRQGVVHHIGRTRAPRLGLAIWPLSPCGPGTCCWARVGRTCFLVRPRWLRFPRVDDPVPVDRPLESASMLRERLPKQRNGAPRVAYRTRRRRRSPTTGKSASRNIFFVALGARRRADALAAVDGIVRHGTKPVIVCSKSHLSSGIDRSHFCRMHRASVG